VGLLLDRLPPLTPSASLSEARRLLIDHRARSLAVVESEKRPRLLGVVTRRTLLQVTATRQAPRVSSIAEEPPLTLSPAGDWRSAARSLVEAREPAAPVVDERGFYLGFYSLDTAISLALRKGSPRLYEKVTTIAKPVERVFSPDDPVYLAWQYILSGGDAAVVVRDGKPLGVVTEYDLLRRGYTRPLFEAGAPRRGPKLLEVMSTPLYTLESSAPLVEAARLIVERRIGRVYIVEDGELKVATRLDVAAALV